MNTKAPHVYVDVPALVLRDPHHIVGRLLDSEKRVRLQCLVHALVQSFAALLKKRTPMPPDWPVAVDVTARPQSGAAPRLDALRLQFMFDGLYHVELRLVAEGAADRAGRNVELRAIYDRRPELPRPPRVLLAPPLKKVVRIMECEEIEFQQRDGYREPVSLGGYDLDKLLRGLWNLQGLALEGDAIFVDRDGRVLADIGRLRLRLVASDDCPEDVARVDVRLPPPAFDRPMSRSPRRA